MSNAIKCDRCGYYTRDARRLHINGVAYVYDLCRDCIRAFEGWMDCGQIADMSEKTPDCVRDGDAMSDIRESAGRVTESVEMLHDTREKLETDVRKHYAYSTTTLMYPPSANETTDMLSALPADTVIGWLDRQAVITERECREYENALREQHHKRTAELKAKLDAEAQHAREAWQLWGEADARAEQMETERDELQREIATLKEHRAANMEKLHELTDECAELRKYRDEWKGLAEKYRADSIAAQEETERCRAKLGDVLDAIHEAERAAR